MDAEKMFNKLGFVKEAEDEHGIGYTNRNGVEVTVAFNFRSHSYYVSENDPMYDTISSACVTIAIHEAITKQLEELGWL